MFARSMKSKGYSLRVKYGRPLILMRKFTDPAIAPGSPVRDERIISFARFDASNRMNNNEIRPRGRKLTFWMCLTKSTRMPKWSHHLLPTNLLHHSDLAISCLACQVPPPRAKDAVR
jgi:hypothetical protein